MRDWDSEINHVFPSDSEKVGIAMTQRIRITLVAATLLALLIPSAALAADFTLAPAQPTVDAGQSIVFTGAGFTPGERVVTWATAPDLAVVSGNYAGAEGAEGRITFSFQVPSNALGGRWAMTAYGLQSKTPVVAFFEVNGSAPATADPQAAVVPAAGPPGTVFAFVARGYDKRERISYWFTGPDGQVHGAYPDSAEANGEGRVDINWTAPGDALRGTWVNTIQGLDSNVARGVPFEIR
jgi:hypothetical protein